MAAVAIVCATAGLAAAPAPRPSAGGTRAAPSILLITLDTTRADHVGPRAGGSLTPNLDALAARGMRYSRALTSSPLTLPAHGSLLSGLDPPAHGVHDNGTAALPPDVPTLATVLSARGYATGAFVASRVLDRRFGLARGFATYDDDMTAERMGEHGLSGARRGRGDDGRPRLGRPCSRRPPVVPLDPLLRRARAVPAAGRGDGRLRRATLRGRGGLRRPRGRPAPGGIAPGSRHRGRGGRPRRDARRARRGRPRHLPVPREPRGAADPGRPRRPPRRRAHPDGRHPRPARDSSDARRDARTRPSGRRSPGSAPRRARRGRSTARPGCPPPRTDGAPCARCRTSDGGTSPRHGRSCTTTWPIRRRRATSSPSGADEARRLEAALASLEAGARARPAPAAPIDPEVAAALRSLGYHSGASGTRSGTLDPKDGIALLREFDRAKELRQSRARARSGGGVREPRGQEPRQRAVPRAPGGRAGGGGAPRRPASRPSSTRSA